MEMPTEKKANVKTKHSLLLPAVKGRMGDRDYILCAMPAEELVSRVILASNLSFPGSKPSDRMQRDENKTRLGAIAEYLERDERFFNALVVAVCGGDVRWRKFSNLEGVEDSYRYVDQLGFLSLSGDETMYVLDGQHRLLGIKKAINDGNESIKKDGFAVVLIQHDQHRRMGKERSRRLFTSLNKYPQKVEKRDIIYLDEDDTAALVVRELVEGKECSDMFKLSLRIHESPKNQFYTGEVTTCLTTIGMLYDCVLLLLKLKEGKKKDELTTRRPDDEEITRMVEYISSFFRLVKKFIPEIQRYYETRNKSELKELVMEKSSRHVLFRPLGLKCFVEAFCQYKKKNPDMSDADCLERCSKLPLSMTERPLRGLVWDKEKVVVPGFPVLKNIYLYMLGVITQEKRIGEIEARYRQLINDEKATLSERI